MKWVRIFVPIVISLALWSGNSYAAQSVFDDAAGHRNYNEIRHYYNLAQDRDEDGLPKKEKYRQVYPDIKDNKFNLYWGQSFDEISSDYELKWGVWGSSISYYTLQLSKIYRRSSPYLILWFDEDKLYRVWMYYPKGIENRKHRQRVINDLTQKFGNPVVYNEYTLMWENTSADVNSIEEEQLEKKFQHNVFRHGRYAEFKNKNK